MSHTLHRSILYLLIALASSSCFGPGLGVVGDGSCAGGDFEIYGKWKMTKGYPSNFALPQGQNFWPANPSKEQLSFHYKVLMLERGVDACVVSIFNKAKVEITTINMKYTHPEVGQVNFKTYANSYWDTATSQWKSVNRTTWLKDSVTYRLSGCSGARPLLTLTYANGFIEEYEVFNRSISGGDCGNNPNPSGS